MERMCILFGGRSGEYDVSLMSTATVIRACSKTKYDLLTVAIDRDGIWYKTTASPDMIEKDDWRKDAEPFDAVKDGERIEQGPGPNHRHPGTGADRFDYVQVKS